jgi:hypothetical protein
MLVFIGAIPLLGALAVRRLRRVTQSPFGKFTEVHPLYLIQVDIDKVSLWPLVNLHDVALTHHLQNGAYQSTSVRMDFGGVPLHLSIRGQQAAVDWAQNLLDTRHRTLSLLSEGLLDSEDGLDLVPPQLLLGVKPKRDPKARRNTRATYAGAAVGGLLLFYGGAVPMNSANAEHEAWNRASGYSSSAQSYREYLKQFPNGRHADQARAAIRGFYDDARAPFWGSNRTQGMAAMAAAIIHLRDRESADVKFEMGGRVNWTAPFADGELKGRVEDVFDDEKSRERERTFLTQFKQALGEHVPEGVLAVDETPKATAPVIFRLDYTATPEYSEDRAHGRRTAGLKVNFDFKVLIGGMNDARGHVTSTVDAGEHDLRDGSLSYTTDAAAYGQLLDDAFARFGRELGAELGIGWPSAATRPSYEYFGRGEEEQRRKDELLQRVQEQLRHRSGGRSDDQ